jgi:hypothetical protein
MDMKSLDRARLRMVYFMDHCCRFRMSVDTLVSVR